MNTAPGTPQGKGRIALCLATLLFLAGRPALAGDWPQWRGPHRNGIAPEASGWEQGGWPPRRLWERPVGYGCSSPILVAGRVYVIGWRGRYHRREAVPGEDVLRCLDAATGKEVWSRAYPSPLRGRQHNGDEAHYGGPSATPTYDAESGWLYTLSIDGDLRAWDTRRDGEPKWRLNLYEHYRVDRRGLVGGGVRDYGYTGSPLVLGDALVVEVGDDEGSVMAFDKRTGRRLWRSQAAEDAGHTGGPVALTIEGVPCVAVLTLRGLFVARAKGEAAGRTVAEYPWETHYGCNIATPAVSGRRVLLTSAYNMRRSCLLEVGLDGARRLWTSRTHALLGSPTFHKGYIYMVSGSLKCLDAKTGRLAWSGGAFEHGSLVVTADDRLIVWGRNRLALVEGATRSPRRYRQLSAVERVLSRADTCYPHVALAGGKILCRDKAGRLACLAIGPPPPAGAR